MILRTYSELVTAVQEIDKLSDIKPATVNIEFTEEGEEKEKAQNYAILLSKVSDYRQENVRRAPESRQPTYGYGQEGLRKIDAEDSRNKSVSFKKNDLPGTYPVEEMKEQVVAKAPKPVAETVPKSNNVKENIMKFRENELMLKPGERIESIKAAANNELKAIAQNIQERPKVHDIKVEPNKDGLVLLKLSVNDQVNELQKILEGVSGREFDAAQMNIVVSEVRGLAAYIGTEEGIAAASKSDVRLVGIRDRLVSDLMIKIGDGDHVGQ